ncbi:hypothetical protein BO94DRAFT_496807 [Aspergillus sclerotioniger CBS 115572]|uniref:Proline-rich protein n=1 Tax=Aspergillus sclerotioniger CBS 115572 TaxID=1450535 RepID=A0A317W120_9EURO|nr:hypothetical protein BO94DRAFT_496807 [Aspergillus sclerotioniger CBS 115572]PWY80344.1 hypothetical protein BO94DRAFT_496807 [Aspergillus sclerotioniger CBS 115572]
MNQFQLFPSPSESRAPRDVSQWARKRPAIRTHTDTIPMEELHGKNSPTEAVIFKLIDDTNSIKPPPKAVSRSTPVSIPETIQERTRSPLYDNVRQRPTERVGSPSHSARTREPSRSQDSSPAAAPVVPMKSRFRYNLGLPLNQQYYPEPSYNGHREYPRPADMVPPSAPEIDQALGPKTVPASVMNFPVGVLDPVETYSSQEELKSLWEVANGQRPRNIPGTSNLRIERIDTDTLAFGHPNAPFYTMRTLGKDISIIRRNPSKQESSVPVMNLKLEAKSRRQPPYDGLVSILFPRLAAILAIDQATELAEELRLSASEAVQAEGDALKRVAAQESCKLLWSQSKQVYELHHPALSKLPALVGAAGIPLSPVQSKYSGVLHIIVSCPSREGEAPTILVTTPLPANAVESAMPATPRTSTLPLTDTDEPLASLDLRSMTLTIATVAIVETIPSLYAIDSLVSAILAVAASDESTRCVLEGLNVYSASGNESFGTSPDGDMITLAEREDDTEGSRLWSKMKSRPDSKQRKWYQFWGQSKPKNREIVVEEFDMDKYGRYGGGSREGQQLPWITRACVRVLFWSLSVMVHTLTAIVKGMAWLVVNLTRCVTRS